LLIIAFGIFIIASFGEAAVDTLFRGQSRLF
jgi:hypothetical protein